MIGIFKQKASTNALLLFIYALVLKFPLFLHPFPACFTCRRQLFIPVYFNGTQFLVRHMQHSLMRMLSFTILFTQATLLNSICNYHKLLPRANYLPAMCYILVTSLLPDWGHFSAPLLINSIMIWCWYRMVALYNSPVTGDCYFQYRTFSWTCHPALYAGYCISYSCSFLHCLSCDRSGSRNGLLDFSDLLLPIISSSLFYILPIS